MTKSDKKNMVNKIMEMMNSITSESTQYTITIDKSHPNFTENSEYNIMMLKQQEVYINIRRKRIGYVFLNEVYDILGVAKEVMGQFEGWSETPVKIEIKEVTDGFISICLKPEGIILDRI